METYSCDKEIMPEKKPSSGFTIVETIIVLAIAGLILLIVLLAIPTVQRSSRNGQRRQGVQAILAALSSYKLNNSGSMPTTGSNFLQYTQVYGYEKTVGYIDVAAGTGTPTDSGVNVYSEAPVTRLVVLVQSPY